MTPERLEEIKGRYQEAIDTLRWSIPGHTQGASQQDCRACQFTFLGDALRDLLAAIEERDKRIVNLTGVIDMFIERYQPNDHMHWQDAQVCYEAMVGALKNDQFLAGAHD